MHEFAERVCYSGCKSTKNLRLCGIKFKFLFSKILFSLVPSSRVFVAKRLCSGACVCLCDSIIIICNIIITCSIMAFVTLLRFVTLLFVTLFVTLLLFVALLLFLFCPLFLLLTLLLFILILLPLCFKCRVCDFYSCYSGSAVSVCDFFDVELLRSLIPSNVEQLLTDFATLLVNMDGVLVFKDLCFLVGFTDDYATDLLDRTIRGSRKKGVCVCVVQFVVKQKEI